MKIKLCGTRGSIPTPMTPEQVQAKIQGALEAYRAAGSPEDVTGFLQQLPFHMRSTYGGNTCCVHVDHGGPESIIIDAGSGLRVLGNELVKKGPHEMHIFISHLHWDHVQGFPFFIPAYVPGNSIHFHCLHDDYERNLRQQQNWQNFPVSLADMRAEMVFHPMAVGERITIGDCQIEPFPHVHPGDSFGFIIHNATTKAVYSSDCDYVDMTPERFKTYTDHFAGADLLVFDAQYTIEEIVSTKYQWGHSSFSVGLDLAKLAGVKRLCFYHHDPANDDATLSDLFARARDYMDLTFAEDEKLELLWARDGLVIEL